MSVTVTATLAGYTTYAGTITATADNDTVTTSTSHGLGVTPKVAGGIQLVSQALTALSAWALTTLSSSAFVFTKLTSSGSGNANPQYQFVLMRPHSLIS